MVSSGGRTAARYSVRRGDGTPQLVYKTARYAGQLNWLVCPRTGEFVDRGHNAARNLRD
jgi:hypothetical protein